MCLKFEKITNSRPYYSIIIKNVRINFEIELLRKVFVMGNFDLPTDFSNDTKNICGYRVRLVREQTRKSNRRKMTQTELAAKLQCLGIECDRLAICRIETGLRSVSDVELVALSKALDVSVNWLLFGKDEVGTTDV